MAFFFSPQAVVRAAAAIPLEALLRVPRQARTGQGAEQVVEFVDLAPLTVGVTLPHLPLPAFVAGGRGEERVPCADGEDLVFALDDGLAMPARRIGLRGQRRTTGDRARIAAMAPLHR